MLTVQYEEIKSRVRLENVIGPVRESFKSYSSGRANIPPVQHLEMPTCGKSALHIKSGHVEPLPFCLVKVASTFPENSRLNPPRPSISGVIIVFSTVTGEPLMLLEDRAWITQIRTAGAGAVAVDLLARKDSRSLGLIGSGTQARLQASAAIHVRPSIDHITVWGRTPKHVSAYIDDMHSSYPGIFIEGAQSPEDVARNSEILITATYAQEPLIRGDWLPDGVLVIAMGADSVFKRELDADAIKNADSVVVDSRNQNEHLGEIGFGIRSGAFGAERIDCELGEILLNSATSGGGRKSRSEKIVCKLTGVAVQEIFVCNSLLRDLNYDLISS